MRFDDAWSQSVQEGARVSAYPLAIWLASSWWRIRWEPMPSRIRLTGDQVRADSDWRLGHELSAAGSGFIWPQLTFASDGESIRVTCRRSPLSNEPVHYLSDFDVAVPALEFEREIDNFIDLVQRRLDPLGETGLHTLWREVLAERADQGQSAARRIEARLGYDADEAPAVLLERFLNLATQAGADTIDEIAPICAGDDPSGALQDVISLASLPGIPGKISILMPAGVPNGSSLPWQRARQFATVHGKGSALVVTLSMTTSFPAFYRSRQRN